MNKLFIITFFVIGLQSDWLEETRRSIAEIDKHAVLMVTKVERDKDITSTMTAFTSNENKKVSVKIASPDLVNFESNYYERNGFVFGEIKHGKNVILYKRKRLANEPYAALVDSRTYFKNNTEGVNLIRKVNIYETDKIEDIRKELNQMEFESNILKGEDYTLLKEISTESQKRQNK